MKIKSTTVDSPGLIKCAFVYNSDEYIITRHWFGLYYEAQHRYFTTNFVARIFRPIEIVYEK